MKTKESKAMLPTIILIDQFNGGLDQESKGEPNTIKADLCHIRDSNRYVIYTTVFTKSGKRGVTAWVEFTVIGDDKAKKVFPAKARKMEKQLLKTTKQIHKVRKAFKQEQSKHKASEPYTNASIKAQHKEEKRKTKEQIRFHKQAAKHKDN